MRSIAEQNNFFLTAHVCVCVCVRVSVKTCVSDTNHLFILHIVCQ